MFRKLFFALAFIATFAASFAQTPQNQSVGLVLSGGGAKGIAHIGVIQALEENNIPIDYVAGTSMGAIIGGLYACGYTPDEMMQLIESPGFAHWSSGKIERTLLYYFSQNEPTPALGAISLGPKDSTEVKSILPSSLISPLPMNFAFMDLFSAYTAQCNGDFDNLFVPFRCVCSDVYHKHKIVLHSGQLGDAIRASMSFPTVFEPIEIDSVLVYDGGIYDNFPVDVMRTNFAPSIMIGSNVSGPDGKPIPNDLFQQLEDMIIQNNDYSLPADEGIKMDVPVRMFGLLDWAKAREIYEIGYRTAMSMMDSIKSRVTARVPAETRTLRRQVFKAHTPFVRFEKVAVEGGSKQQNEYIEYLFTQNRPDTFGIERARDAYYRALTPGRLRNLVPQASLNPNTGLFDLTLKATAKDNYNVGVGGYVSSSTSSMLFMSAGYNTLSFNSTEMNVNAWIGQSYMAAAFNAKMNLRTHIPSRLHLQVVGSRQKFYESNKLFFEESQPVFITKSQVFGRLYFEWAAGQRGKAGIGTGWGHMADKFFHNKTSVFDISHRDETIRNLGQVIARYSYSTLDNLSYPTVGAAYHATVMGVAGNNNYHPNDSLSARIHTRRKWLQAELTTSNYFDLSRKISLGIETDLLWSSRSLLNNYYATIVEAPGFNPTASSYNSFNTSFRANSFAAVGVVPVWKLGSMLQLRGCFHGFMPLRKILDSGPDTRPVYGHWLSNPEFFGEVAGIVTLPFASVTAYANYTSHPARNWNFGLSFGVFILAPRFLR